MLWPTKVRPSLPLDIQPPGGGTDPWGWGGSRRHRIAALLPRGFMNTRAWP